MQGHDGIAAGLAQFFAKNLAGSQISWIRADTMFNTEDIAVCHVQWNRVRLADVIPLTLPPGTGIFALVVHRMDGD